MALLETAVVLVASLAVLFLASREVIQHALVLAKVLRISEAAVGFLLLAVATSLPELAVGVLAAFHGVIGISIGTVLGSNIADIALVLGVTAVLARRIPLEKKQTSTLVKILFATSLLPLSLLLFPLSRVFAGFLLLAFVAFAYYTLREHVSPDVGDHAPSAREAVFSALWFAASIAVVLFSSDYAVNAAVDLAALLNFSNTFIGATVVALGTSLPELAINLSAVFTRRLALAVGNILGSAVTNITLVLGASAFIAPTTVTNPLAFLSLIVFAVIANLFLWYFVHENKQLARREGIVLIAVYLVFLASTLSVELA